jgi:hypothetical protein
MRWEPYILCAYKCSACIDRSVARPCISPQKYATIIGIITIILLNTYALSHRHTLSRIIFLCVHVLFDNNYYVQANDPCTSISRFLADLGPSVLIIIQSPASSISLLYNFYLPRTSPPRPCGPAALIVTF